MEKVNWQVEGMSCTNCALSIHKYLEEEGVKNIKVNFIGGEVSFELNGNKSREEIQKGIRSLGYQVKTGNGHEDGHHHHLPGIIPFRSQAQRFLFCLVFTIPLFFAHMLPWHIHFLMNHWVQLALAIPVYFVGMDFFGRSAIKSLRKGVPNMNVLIALGATAAFVYSLIGTIQNDPEKIFYETAATILTLVFLGNWMEDKSVETTQRELKKLASTQKVMANMIAFDENHQEQIFPVESTQLKVGDLILIKTGEYVPMDAKILWGEASVNEAIITGESVPVEKKMNDRVIGGSILENGTVKAYVTAVGEDSVMGHILRMVRDAQAEKPPVQQLADRISAWFVPVVIGISLVALAGNYFFADHSFRESLMRSIAVLVIACPCAMGLATPAAIAVGLGRAARSGVLFKNAKSLEVFKDIRQVVFDKTGTLTTGHFAISRFNSSIDEAEFKRIAYSLEKYSNHPVARAVSRQWKQPDEIRWDSIEEVKGLGIKARSKDGNNYVVGSFKVAAGLTEDPSHSIYLVRNNHLLGWIDVADDLRPEAKGVIAFLHSKNIRTILLSGDQQQKTDKVAKELGIDEVIAEQTPEEKLKKIAALNAEMPTAMVGDGINDAPALAKATVGISLSDASQVAMNSAQVVLMNHGLKNLPLSLGLGRHTYLTIKQNLFWAFCYNIVAIPVAAFGYLSPTFGALVMGFSDVVLAVNSIRLKFKKVT
ncbi:MAG TPA: cation-translocating P-type ATPase [Chitinophagaceae bacterium]